MQSDELFLLILFVHMGSESEPKLKEKHPPTLLRWIKMDFQPPLNYRNIAFNPLGVFNPNRGFMYLYPDVT